MRGGAAIAMCAAREPSCPRLGGRCAGTVPASRDESQSHIRKMTISAVNPRRVHLWFDPGSHSFWSSLGLLVLRAGAGGLLLAGHGWTKMTNFSKLVDTFPDPLGLGSGPSLIAAIGAEVICASLVVVGFVTRWACVPIVVMLLVAATVVHATDPWKAKEFAIIFALPFLALFFTGPGRFSVDHYLTQRGLEGGIPGIDRVSDPNL